MLWVSWGGRHQPTTHSHNMLLHAVRRAGPVVCRRCYRPGGIRSPYTASATILDGKDEEAADFDDAAESEAAEEEEDVRDRFRVPPVYVAPEDVGGEGLPPILAPRMQSKIAALHKSDPEEWSVEKLAQKFGMKQDQANEQQK